MEGPNGSVGNVGFCLELYLDGGWRLNGLNTEGNKEL
jgi:hypothetical protein